MKNWDYSKMNGTCVRIDDRLADMMGLIEGGCVYSTLFEYVDKGPKRYELILSMYPQENYRTLTNITMYMQDVPGSSAQAARFLGERGINILNSISLDGISDSIIIWKMLVDLSFAGEADIIRERFAELKAANDASVSKIDHIEIKPADIGRVFKAEPAKEKNELRRGAPVTLKNSSYDVAVEYGDLLKDIDDADILIAADYASWLVSVTFFKKDTKLIKMAIEIPDCPGSIIQVLDYLADRNVNLISVFSKVKICYQTMTLELVGDLSKCKIASEELKRSLPAVLDGLNGVFELKEYSELR